MKPYYQPTSASIDVRSAFILCNSPGDPGDASATPARRAGNIYLQK